MKRFTATRKDRANAQEVIQGLVDKGATQISLSIRLDCQQSVISSILQGAKVSNNIIYKILNLSSR